MTNPTINGKYNPMKLAQVWLEERRRYTTCIYYDRCKYARILPEHPLCLDTPDECSVKKKLDEMLEPN